MNLTYNGEKAKLDGNHLFTKSKKVIHISDLKKEYDTINNSMKNHFVIINYDKFFELENIIETWDKL